MNTIRVLFDEGGAVRAADLHDLLFAQGAAFLDLDYTEGVPAVDHACRVFGLDGFSRDVGELALGCRVVAAVARSSGVDLAGVEFSGYWTRGDLDGATADLRQ